MNLADFNELLISHDPYPALAQLQAAHSVHQLGGQTWMVCKYHDVARVLKDSKHILAEPVGRGLSATHPEGAAQSYLRHRMNFLDPPEHSQVRKAVEHWFTPQRIRNLESDIITIVDDLCGTMTTPEVDLLQAIAHPLPVRVICRLLNAPVKPELSLWSNAVANLLSAHVSDQQRVIGGQAAESFAAWVATIDKPANINLSDHAWVALVMMLFTAGHHTTRDLFANGMYHLLCHPKQKEAALENPELAVKEFLRFDTPTTTVARVPIENIVIAGKRIPPHSYILALLCAANRDPDVYPDPHQFDVTRTGTPPLSFGSGPHYCLGVLLAKLEVRIMLQTMLQRWPQIRLADPTCIPPRRPVMTFHGITRLPVILS